MVSCGQLQRPESILVHLQPVSEIHCYCWFANCGWAGPSYNCYRIAVSGDLGRRQMYAGGRLHMFDEDELRIVWSSASFRFDVIPSQPACLEIQNTMLPASQSQTCLLVLRTSRGFSEHLLAMLCGSQMAKTATMRAIRTATHPIQHRARIPPCFLMKGHPLMLLSRPRWLEWLLAFCTLEAQLTPVMSHQQSAPTLKHRHCSS
jgi:hypothetical protein